MGIQPPRQTNDLHRGVPDSHRSESRPLSPVGDQAELCRLADHESRAAPAVQSKGRHNREVGTIGDPERRDRERLASYGASVLTVRDGLARDASRAAAEPSIGLPRRLGFEERGVRMSAVFVSEMTGADARVAAGRGRRCSRQARRGDRRRGSRPTDRGRPGAPRRPHRLAGLRRNAHRRAADPVAASPGRSRPGSTYGIAAAHRGRAGGARIVCLLAPISRRR